MQLWRHGSVVAGSHAEAAADQLFELAVPFRSLARKTDEPVHFYVELLQGRSSRWSACRTKARSKPSCPRPITN